MVCQIRLFKIEVYCLPNVLAFGNVVIILRVIFAFSPISSWASAETKWVRSHEGVLALARLVNLIFLTDLTFVES